MKLSGFRSQTRSGHHARCATDGTIRLHPRHGSRSRNGRGRTPLVETQTSALGHVIDNTRDPRFPLNGRNPLELSRLTPGVTLLATAFLDTRNFNLTSVSINGGQGGSNAVLLDGGSTTLPERNEYAVAPNVDAVQEFRVQTNALAAEFGMTGGGVINLVTKSGTNQFRGTLFEFLRDDAFDATGWTNNRNNLAKSPLSYHQFGGTIGGPLWLPKGLGTARLRWAQPVVLLLQLRRHSLRQCRRPRCRACPPSSSGEVISARRLSERRAAPSFPSSCTIRPRRVPIPPDPASFATRLERRSCPDSAWIRSRCAPYSRIRSRTGPPKTPAGATTSSATPGRSVTATSTTAGSIIKSADQPIVRPLLTERSRQHRKRADLRGRQHRRPGLLPADAAQQERDHRRHARRSAIALSTKCGCRSRASTC